MAEHILVLDGEAAIRDAIAHVLIREGFEVHQADSPESALHVCAQIPELAVVVSQAPLPDPANTLAKVKSAHPMIRTIAVSNAKGDGWGVDEHLTLPLEMSALVSAVDRLARALRADRERLALLEQLRRNVVRMVDSLAQALEARDPYTAGHSLRVAEYSLLIAEELGFTEYEKELLRHGAALHDIGKIAVSQEVLHKPGRLTADEYEHIKMHPVVGREILEPIDDFGPMLEMVYHHHERIDGQGYPEGLAGDRIPVMAQIVAVADTYDAMTSDRPYRQGMHREKALAIMTQVAGTQLNAEFVAIFARRIRAAEAANAHPRAV
ncbi:MAG TPA: HD domain-containing phosphohydrolase [Oscillatoriaceae cyanobacterium]